MAPIFGTQLLAQGDGGAIIAIVLSVLYGAFWLIKKLAEGKQQQRIADDRERDRRDAGNGGKEEAAGFVADRQQVRRFLETLGMETDIPPQPPRPATTNAPDRPPQRLLRNEPEPPVLTALPRAPQPRAAPPRPKAHPVKAHAPKPEPKEEYAFGSPTARPDHRETPEISAAHRHVAAAQEVKTRKAVAAADRLAFPHLPPLQRAIVLSDILGRRPGR